MPPTMRDAVMTITIWLYRDRRWKDFLCMISFHTKKPRPPHTIRQATVSSTTGLSE